MSTGTTVLNMTITKTIPQSTSSSVTTFTTTHEITLTSTILSTGTSEESSVFTSTSLSEVVSTTEEPITSTEFYPPTGTDETTTEVIPVTSTFTSAATTTESHRFITYGPTVITSTFTVDLPVSQPPPQTIEKPVTQVFTVTDGGATKVVVQTGAPGTRVVETGGQVLTKVVNQPPQTIVTLVGGGTPTTIVVVTTPTPERQGVTVGGGPTTVGGSVVTLFKEGPQTVVTNIGGKSVTVVEQNQRSVVTEIGGTPVTIFQQGPQTVVTDIDGTQRTILITPTGGSVATVGATVETVDGIVITSGGFRPISWTEVETVGGTVETVVQTQAPFSFTTVIDGTLTTMWTTPPPITSTTLVGGTVTTLTFQTTPTGTDPITYTITTMVSGSLSTYVTSGVPSTIVTTISGHLTTITSTPSPSSYTTTLPKSTHLSTSVSTSTGAAPEPTGGGVAVKTTTAIYNLQPWDYFLGTFLPTFLAVMLVLPLRVIDLNAKLYQPFHAMTRPGGASGPNSLTLQYSGILGFITPIISLADGQPVPFITTLMVLSSSLMAPLATEALGLKVHGSCTLESTDGCALALGISIAPTFALIGVICLVIGLLITLLFLLRRYETGVYSNPWNIAGIASLAGNPDVRILQTGQAKVREIVNKKQYSLGYFENQSGHEEYGIVLMDDSSRGLRGERDDGNEHRLDDDDLYDEDPIAGGVPLGRRVPFMALTVGWRVSFMVFLTALLAFVLYYHISGGQAAPIRLFISSNSFGVRFLFAGLGVIITFFWSALFLSTSSIPPSLAFSPLFFCFIFVSLESPNQPVFTQTQASPSQLPTKPCSRALSRRRGPSS